MTGLALSLSMIIMSSGLASSTSTQPASTTQSATVQMTAEEVRFVELTNAERLRRGLTPLVVDPVLLAAARDHSREMSTLNYFSHTSPTKSLQTPMKRYLDKLGKRPDYAMVGENLFYCSKVDVNRGQNALMQSPGHRDNILEPRYERIGVGICKSSDGSFWVTEMFLCANPDRVASAARTLASSGSEDHARLAGG